METTIGRVAALMVLITLASAFAYKGASHSSTRRAIRTAASIATW